MDIGLSRRDFLAGTSAAAGFGGTPALAQARTALTVMAFPGHSNLSVFSAQHKGFFARRGLAVELKFTPNSGALREGLAKGEHHIAHAGVDNAVAMVEQAKADAVIVTGGDNGFNTIFVQPEIGSLAEIRGKTIAVDAPNTAYALLLYKVLKDAGLGRGDYQVRPVGGSPERLAALRQDKNLAAAVLFPPFSFQAQEAGLKDMGPAARVVGAYQAEGAFVMRDWAKANGEVLVRYIAALIEGRRWALDPANRSEATGLLAERLRLSPEIAAKTFAVISHPTAGMAKDAKFDLEGFRNVLKLRAEIEGQWGGIPPAPERYFDLSYYDRALANL